MFFFDYWTVFSTLIQFIHELAPRSLWLRYMAFTSFVGGYPCSVGQYESVCSLLVLFESISLSGLQSVCMSFIIKPVSCSQLLFHSAIKSVRSVVSQSVWFLFSQSFVSPQFGSAVNHGAAMPLRRTLLTHKNPQRCLLDAKICQSISPKMFWRILLWARFLERWLSLTQD